MPIELKSSLKIFATPVEESGIRSIVERTERRKEEAARERQKRGYRATEVFIEHATEVSRIHTR